MGRVRANGLVYACRLMKINKIKWWRRREPVYVDGFRAHELPVFQLGQQATLPNRLTYYKPGGGGASSRYRAIQTTRLQSRNLSTVPGIRAPGSGSDAPSASHARYRSPAARPLGKAVASRFCKGLKGTGQRLVPLRRYSPCCAQLNGTLSRARRPDKSADQVCPRRTRGGWDSGGRSDQAWIAWRGRTTRAATTSNSWRRCGVRRLFYLRWLPSEDLGDLSANGHGAFAFARQARRPGRRFQR